MRGKRNREFINALRREGHYQAFQRKGRGRRNVGVFRLLDEVGKVSERCRQANRAQTYILKKCAWIHQQTC